MRLESWATKLDLNVSHLATGWIEERDGIERVVHILSAQSPLLLESHQQILLEQMDGADKFTYFMLKCSDELWLTARIRSRT